jgi:hypothetical protein
MRQEFVEVATIQEAQAAAPWAAEIVEVEGGFQAFESMADYNNWIKNSDQDTEDDDSEKMPSVEVCKNVEWVRENEINKDGIDEADFENAANTYSEAVYDALTEKGWNVSWSKKERITFHGWNGARFTTKRGCVGSWEKLTDDQLAIIDEARKLADDAVKVWVKTDEEARREIIAIVEEENVSCPEQVCDAVLAAWKNGENWNAVLAEAVANDAKVAKQLGVE